MINISLSNNNYLHRKTVNIFSLLVKSTNKAYQFIPSKIKQYLDEYSLKKFLNCISNVRSFEENLESSNMQSTSCNFGDNSEGSYSFLSKEERIMFEKIMTIANDICLN